MIEFAEKMLRPGVMTEWASNVVHKNPLTDDEKEISEVVDGIFRKIGETGKDPNGEIASLVKKSFTPDAVSAPSELISRMFDEGNIGEFDDFYMEREPENTMKAYEATTGGNVDASYIEHAVIKPTWKSLQAETYIPHIELRKGGYHTVAKYVDFINETFENTRVAMIMKAVDDLILSGSANYIAESTAKPTAASADELVLYLHDRVEQGEVFMFMLNKYRQAMSKLTQAERWPTEGVKNQYNTTGFVEAYAGVNMLGFSGQRKLAGGGLVVPDKRIFGVAGKVGQVQTRGSVRVLETEDNNAERIHLKVTGYTFGYCVSDMDKIAKIVMAA